MSRRQAILTGAFVVLAVAFGAYFVGAVAASHFTHAGMDKKKQILPADSGRDTKLENYVNNRWALHDTGQPIRWYAATDEAHRNLFIAALAKWTASTTVPLLWKEVNSSDDADVEFYSSGTCDDDSLGGSFDVKGNWSAPNLTDRGWVGDDIRSANYWQKAEICLSTETGKRATDDHQASVVAHEIGHAYGFHHVYYDDESASRRGCNDSVTSIMDGPRKVWSLNQLRMVQGHCDEITRPSQWDIDRVEDFYASGGPVDFTVTATGTTATFRWKDDAWGSTIMKSPITTYSTALTRVRDGTSTASKRSLIVSVDTRVSRRTIFGRPPAPNGSVK